jgi:hypothetical protein
MEAPCCSFPRLRGRVPKADGGSAAKPRCCWLFSPTEERPLQPFGQLVLATSLWLALRAASAANIGNPADISRCAGQAKAGPPIFSQPLRACEENHFLWFSSIARPVHARTRSRESVTCVTDPRPAIRGRAERLKNSQPLSACLTLSDISVIIEIWNQKTLSPASRRSPRSTA